MSAHAPPGVGIQSSQASRTITCTSVLLVGSWCTIQSFKEDGISGKRVLATAAHEGFRLWILSSWMQLLEDLTNCARPFLIGGDMVIQFHDSFISLPKEELQGRFCFAKHHRLMKVHEICSLKGETLSFLPANTCTPCKAPQLPHSFAVQVTSTGKLHDLFFASGAGLLK